MLRTFVSAAAIVASIAAGASAAPVVRHTTSIRTREPSAVTAPFDSGQVNVGAGVRLNDHILGGTHRDTVVFVHGGPGLSASYLQKDLDFRA